MLRLQDNTPSIYCQKSRDFQLFCRLYDTVNNGVKFDIDSIININNATLISDRVINLLCTKVGFFPKHNYSTSLLRGIIQVFPYMIKYKGSLRGIEYAVRTVLKFEDIKGSYEIILPPNIKGQIDIYVSIDLENKLALDDLLSYVLPIGYIYKLQLYKATEANSDLKTDASLAKIVSAPTTNISQIRGTDRIQSTTESNNFNFENNLQNKAVSLVGWNVIGSTNYNVEKTKDKDRNNTIRNNIFKAEQFKTKYPAEGNNNG